MDAKETNLQVSQVCSLQNHWPHSFQMVIKFGITALKRSISKIEISKVGL